MWKALEKVLKILFMNDTDFCRDQGFPVEILIILSKEIVFSLVISFSNDTDILFDSIISQTIDLKLSSINND